jgi:hypothetical protein
MARKHTETYDFKGTLKLIEGATETADLLLAEMKKKSSAPGMEDRVREFLTAVEAASKAVEGIPVRDGVASVEMTPAGLKELNAQLAILTPKLQTMIERHGEVTARMRDLLAADKDRLNLLRHAREIFDHFVRKGRGAKPPPRFFDREG